MKSTCQITSNKASRNQNKFQIQIEFLVLQLFR